MSIENHTPSEAVHPSAERICHMPGLDPICLAPWLQTLRQDRTIAQSMAQALTPTLLAAYIDRFITTDQSPSRRALEDALDAQRSDLVRHLTVWLRRRPSVPQQEAVWHALGQWLRPSLLECVRHALENALGLTHLEALSPEAQETTVQTYVGTTACPHAQVQELLHHDTRGLVQALTHALDLPQRTHEELQALLRLRPIQRAAEAPQSAGPLFQTRTVTPIATGGPMLSSAQALLRRDLWHEDDDGKPFYRRGFKKGRYIEHYITNADPTSQDPEALAGKAAWQIVEQFGIPTAYLHLVFAAHAAEQQQPWHDMFHLHGHDLIQTLGMDRRTDLTKAEKLQEIAKQAGLLGSVGVWVVWSEGKRNLNVRTSRMWDVAIDIHGHDNPRHTEVVPDEITLTVRPGLWTEKFLNREGQQARTALRQFGYLAKETLQINPYHEELAAKLAVYLTIMSRLRHTYRVKNLLMAVESEDTLDHASHDRRRRYDFKRRWDSALLTLHERRWTIAFDAETYPVSIRPDWALPEDIQPHIRQLPPGYFTLLLAALITLTPPDPIPRLITTGKEKTSRKASTHTPPHLVGSQVKHAREAKGWSQRHLARLIGKSQGWIALIERGKRTIRPGDGERLQDVLELDV